MPSGGPGMPKTMSSSGGRSISGTSTSGTSIGSGSSGVGSGIGIRFFFGFGFGFVLERAGFGRSTKLAAQFYLYDMTVFKVMFTAIVTVGIIAVGLLLNLVT